MKKKIYIHVGTHKTGTTTIQHIMRDNFELLKSEGLIYLQNIESIKKLINIDCIDADLVEEIRGEVEEETLKYPQIEKFIISWEGLSGSFYKGYANSNVISKTIHLALEENFNCSIIMYLRDQAEFIESIYTQSIHSGRNIDLDDFLNKMDYKVNLDWRVLIDSYKIFDDLNVMTFKSDGPSHDLINSFGKIVGSDTLKLMSVESRKNKSYSKGAIDLAKRVNSTLTEAERRNLRVILQSLSKGQPAKLISDDIKSEISRIYSNSNRGINESYNTDLSISSKIGHDVIELVEDEFTAISKMIVSIDLESKRLSRDLSRLDKAYESLLKENKDIRSNIKSIHSELTKINDIFGDRTRLKKDINSIESLVLEVRELRNLVTKNRSFMVRIINKVMKRLRKVR